MILYCRKSTELILYLDIKRFRSSVYYLSLYWVLRAVIQIWTIYLLCNMQEAQTVIVHAIHNYKSKPKHNYTHSNRCIPHLWIPQMFSVSTVHCYWDLFSGVVIVDTAFTAQHIILCNLYTLWLWWMYASTLHNTSWTINNICVFKGLWGW